MALWGNTDAGGSKPKYITDATELTQVFFVDQEEAQKTSNRIKGIKTPGWNKVVSYVDSSGQTRTKVECLISMAVLNATAGDAADDAVVGDVEFSISTQPSDSSVTAPAATSFVVAVSAGGGSFQWQVRSGSGAYANVSNGGVYSGATTATLSISDSTGLTGNRYRVICANAGTTVSVTSRGALLTVS